jgi:dihydroorotase
MSVNPRNILGLSNSILEAGNSGNFILFDPSEEWIFDENTNFSKSLNSPFIGGNLTGKIKLVYNNEQYIRF